MKCRDVMTANPTCCVPTDSAVQVAKMMKTENVGSIPVCEGRQNRKLVGIVTDRDLAMQVVAEARDATITKVQDVMTGKPFSCRPDDELQRACDTMELKQVRRIPVVDDKGLLIGIIAQADLATRGGEPEMTAEVVEEISKPISARAA